MYYYQKKMLDNITYHDTMKWNETRLNTMKRNEMMCEMKLNEMKWNEIEMIMLSWNKGTFFKR